MIHKYDESIIKLFRKLFDDDTISIVPPERAKDIKAQLESDDVKFPLISLNRTGWSVQSNKINWAASRIGVLDRVEDNNKAQILHSIPIRIEYQLDVYTVDKISADEIYRELIFYVLLHPTLLVDIEYGLNTEHKFNLYFNDDIEDNSDTAEHVNNGVLYRHTATLYTDDAYLFAKTESNVVLPGGIRVETKD